MKTNLNSDTFTIASLKFLRNRIARKYNTLTKLDKDLEDSLKEEEMKNEFAAL